MTGLDLSWPSAPSGGLLAMHCVSAPWRGRKDFGAGKEARTPDLNLGKVALYQLSYSRP
jgi:hypothetical protein